MNKNGNFSRFFVYFFVLIIILFFGYKYYEYKTIKDFVEFQNQSENKEYRLTEKSGQLSEKLNPLINSFYGIEDNDVSKKTKKTDAQLLTENYDLATKIININKIDLDISTEYGNLLKSDLKTYKGYKQKLSFILSQNSKILREFIDAQLIYYENEIKSNDDNLITNAFLQNYFEISQERLIVDNLDKTFAGKTKKYYTDNYNMFSTLEKYTRSDFTFFKNDLIKEKRPYGYEWLDKNRKYFSAYYELIKEYTYGDEDSYLYKYEKFKTLLSDFNIDMNKVFDEGNLDSTERQKNILKAVFDKFLIGNKLKQNKFNIFPIFGKVKLINTDLVMCQSYQYRYSIYNDITGKYPTGKNIDELIKEFDTANLSNKEADSIFDKTLLNYTESEDKVNFECKNVDNEDSFNFFIIK